MDGLVYAYAAEITKATEQGDGTLMVYGKATGPDLDLDGQRCDPAWLKGAMPEWFKWGNIREQHGPIAAGIGVELEEKGDDWWVKAHVVDPGTVAKVRAKVLKGFSVGIKNGQILKTAAVPKGIICKGDVVEVSLVDRPSNPTCAINIAKSAGGMGDSLEAVYEGGDVVDLAETDELDGDLRALRDDLDADKAAEADGELETVGDVRKGFIMDLLSGKNDQKRDHGKFAPGPHAPSDTEKRRAERLRARAEQKAHDAQEDKANAEALTDADRARRSGRVQEAGEHLAVAASHARTPGQYRRVRNAQRHTESLMREKGVEGDIVKAWSGEIDELLGAEPEAALDLGEMRSALAVLRDLGDGMIVKRADEAADIDGAWAAISQIADLIISEAGELKNRCPEEIQDIAILIEAVRGLHRFIRNEMHEDGMGSDSTAADFAYAAEGDIFKSAGASGDAIDGATLVAAGEIHKAVTEATAPLMAELATLREVVARVEKMPIPGGPFVMTTAPHAAAAAPQDHAGTSAFWRSRAAQISDPGAQAAYLAKARELEGASS